MTMLFMDGFDTKDQDIKYVMAATNGLSINNSLNYGAATRFSSGFAFTPPNQGSGGTQYGTGVTTYTKSLTPSSQVFVGAAMQAGSTAAATNQAAGPGAPFFVLGGDSGSTFHLYLDVNANGVVELYRGNGTAMATSGNPLTYIPDGTKLASSSTNAMPTGWHFVEMSAVINASSGSATVKVDGATVISFTGNTKNGGTSTNIDTLVLVGMSSITLGVAYIYLNSPVYDDLYVLSSSGASNNTFLGDSRVQTCLPTANGTYTQLTPHGLVGANQWGNAAQVPRNYPSYYNGSTATSQQDTYVMSDLTPATGTVYALQQVSNVIKSDAGAASCKNVQKSGATVSYGVTSALTTNMTSNLDMFETNPATSAAWTPSGVNGLEAGIASV
jgi:hypothetical protein